MENKEYLKVAVKAATESGKIFKQYFGKPLSVKLKSGQKNNFVTNADLSIEAVIKKIILNCFPDHNILGEESGWKKQSQPSEVIWVIDPIDGTTNFIHNIPFCCISIAAWTKGKPVAACVFDPLQNNLYTATQGGGAFLNGKRISVSKTNKLVLALGGFGWNEAYDPSLIKTIKLVSDMVKSAKKLRVLASTTLQMAYVAAGIFDFYTVTTMKAWDFAASSLLITEAGGKVTDWQGKFPSLESSSLVSSNGKIHGQILKKLKAIS